MSVAVVGADYPNKRGPGRRFEIAVCAPGEPVVLTPEPKNPADPRAVAVYSVRGVQIGYLTAERCGLISRAIAEGAEMRAVFQAASSFGAWVRITFDGTEPALPAETSRPSDDQYPDFYPDPEPDYG